MSLRRYSSSVWQWLTGARRAPRRPPRRPRLEALEDRLTPSAGMVGDQLQILGGTGASADTITIEHVAGNLVVHERQGNTVLPNSTFALAPIDSILINTGDGDDEINAELPFLLGISTVAILGGRGNDKIILNPSGKDLSYTLSQSRLILDGGDGSDRVEVNDQSTDRHTYRVTDSAIEFIFANISHNLTQTSVEDLVLNTAARSYTSETDAIVVESTAAGSAVTINAGSANTVIVAGTSDAGLTGLRGTSVTFNGLGGNTLNIDDQASGGPHTYSLYASAVTRAGAARINFSGVGNVPVHGGGFDDTFVVLGTPPAGTTVAFNGHGGNDTLDYSSFGAGVSVDLAAHTATALGGGVFEVENVIGSFSNDFLYGDGGGNILVGLGGDDTLDGRAGYDFLIGGGGADTLTGGTGQDIKIGGTTSYDNRWTTITIREPITGRPISRPFYLGVDYTALQSIMTAWQSPGTFSQRTARIGSGVGPNGQYKLDATTVQDDGVTDPDGSFAEHSRSQFEDWLWS